MAKRDAVAMESFAPQNRGLDGLIAGLLPG
jgi:hypothetical protein